jgi:hypothetical protein
MAWGSEPGIHKKSSPAPASPTTYYPIVSVLLEDLAAQRACNPEPNEPLPIPTGISYIILLGLGNAQPPECVAPRNDGYWATPAKCSVIGGSALLDGVGRPRKRGVDGSMAGVSNGVEDLAVAPSGVAPSLLTDNSKEGSSTSPIGARFAKVIFFACVASSVALLLFPRRFIIQAAARPPNIPAANPRANPQRRAILLRIGNIGTSASSFA